jgi:HlyD family secretion protein
MSAPPPDLSSLRIARDAPVKSGGGRSRTRTAMLTATIAAAVAAGVGTALLAPRPVRVQVASVAVTGGAGAAGSISANGYVVARTKASVSAKIPGRMEYLGVNEGSRVKKGEVIARIESADQRAAIGSAVASVAQVEAQLAQARRDLDRAQKLLAAQVLSPADLENARTRVGVLEAQLGSAKAQLQQANVELENTRVRAPFDGTVLRKDAEVGEIVAPSSAGGGLTRTAIVTMADLATLEVEVDVNEAYIAQVHNGEPARITLDAYPDTSFAGSVRQVVPTADRQKATVLVKVSILDRDPRILPEMGAKVDFTPESGAAVAALPRRVLVPAAAVHAGSGGPQVWLVENGKVTARAIETGAERNGQLEVRRGLSGGESVVLNPPASLRDGRKVRVGTS